MFKNKLNSFLLMNVSYSWLICHINGISRWYTTNDYSFKADSAFQQQLIKNRYLYFNKFYHLPSCLFWQSVLFNSKIPIICEWRTFLMCFREIQRLCCYYINHTSNCQVWSHLFETETEISPSSWPFERDFMGGKAPKLR